MGDTNFDMKTDNLLCDLCVMYNLRNLVGGPTIFLMTMMTVYGLSTNYCLMLLIVQHV